MQVEVFSVCDAATVDGAGKLNILGAFDTLWAAQVPVVHPQMSIVLRVRFEQIERGEHKVSFSFVDFDGKHVLPPAEGAINVTFQDDQRSGSANSILNIQRAKFETFGEYAIHLSIDGQQAASLPLFVMRAGA